MRVKKHSTLKPIGEILSTIIKKRKMPLYVEQRELRVIWDTVVGPSIAAHTSPSHVKKGVLYVHVSSSAWLHQLQFLKNEIVEKLNEAYPHGKIQSMHLSLGEIPPVKIKKEMPTLSPSPSLLFPRDQKLINECTRLIADPELKAVFKAAMIAEISRRRSTK
ncbi:MAG: DUF721 domain-containing protein [Syntrophales bacterium]|nr:DUF721 domain-containing protein [Syntrophales bacterium]